MTAAAKVLKWPSIERLPSIERADRFLNAFPDSSFSLTPPFPMPPKKLPRRRKPPVSLSDEQFLALLGKAKEHRLRDWILILFTWRHGFRASEGVGVTVADIDLHEGKVFVRRGKGSEGGWQDLLSWPENPLMDERAAMEFWLANRAQFGVKGGAKRGARKPAKAPAKMQQSIKIVAFSQEEEGIHAPLAGPDCITAPTECPSALGVLDHAGLPREIKPAGGPEPLSQASVELLGPPAPPQTPSERLFPIGRSQFWRLVHKYALAAGIPARKCKTHMLKHTIAKQLVRAGHPVNEIMEWMGWRSMETMMWYIRPDEEELGQRIGDRMKQGMTGLRQVKQGSLFP